METSINPLLQQEQSQLLPEVLPLPNVQLPGEMVLSVIDGDSFKIGKDQTIRLASLDAPETEECSGPESKKFLKEKIEGKKVYLKELQTDRYGRIMALVYLKGELINEYMIKNGLALHIWDSSSKNKILDKANNFARENKLGIISEKCLQKEPPNPKCAIKGNLNRRTKIKEYVTPECWYYSMSIVEKYRGEEWFCSEKEAQKAGYIKSNNCK